MAHYFYLILTIILVAGFVLVMKRVFMIHERNMLKMHTERLQMRSEAEALVGRTINWDAP